MRTRVFLALLFMGAVVLGADERKPFDLTTLLGQTFKNCRIIKATPEGITVSHDNGVSKIPFESLNDEWKSLFHYSTESSLAFQKAEAQRRSLAEEKRRQLLKEQEDRRTKTLGEFIASENLKRKKLEETFARQQADAAASTAIAAISQTWPLAPLPGDLTPFLGTPAASPPDAVHPADDVLVPSNPPIGAVYMPGTTGGQRYIINEGTVYTNGDGTIYSGYPGYVNPGFVTPGCVNPPIVIYQQGAIRPQVPVRPIPQVNQVPTTTTYRIGRGASRTGP